MRPMLAVAAPTEGIRFPVYASAKIDGVRAVVKDGLVYTRKLEVMPNAWVQRLFGHAVLEGLDGELCCGPAYADNVFQETQSAVMSQAGTPDVMFYVFDYWNGPPGEPYSERYAKLQDAFASLPYASHPYIQLLEQRLVHNMEDLTLMQEDHLVQGYEGLMLRDPQSPYKFGRSTAKQGWMLKLKRWETGEARIIGYEELMRNENELEENQLGLAKRSKASDGLVPAGVLGSLRVADCKTGIHFGVGSGFDAAQRLQLWEQRDTLLGKIIRYKHFEVGVKVAPRFPVFQGFRDERDMGLPE